MLARLTTLLLALVAVTGCQPGAASPDIGLGGQSQLPPTLARMQRTYADLHTGRFVLLADFNTRPQAELFRTLGPDGRETADQPTISLRHSIDATGAGGLKAHLTTPNDRLLFDGARSQNLVLVRDWREYNILLLNIHGPPGGLMLEFSAQSGTDLPIRFTRTLFAKAGWHLCRLDLGELSEEIDLADVRALSWRAPEMTAPVDLYLDDLILADNTRWLLGDNAAEDQLYVLTRGRRIHVGARGRFELAFCDGLIVQWHADSEQNLTVRSGLGPWPIPLPSDWSSRRADPVVYDDPALFASWGARYTATQRLVEKSGFRVVIEGLWRFLPNQGPADPAATPQHCWRYVVYPSGEVYVQVSSSVGNASWSAARVGHAVALAGRYGFERVAANPRGDEPDETSFVLMSQPGRDRPDLLWCPHRPDAARRQLELVSADARRIAVTVGDVEPAGTLETAHLLRFWPHDIDGSPEARSFAADYQRPATLTVSRGRVVADTPGDLDGDGFNESEGCHELAPVDGVLRFKLLAGGLLRHHAIFRVHATDSAECWVYADGRIIGHQERDNAGNLLFALPGAVNRVVTLEVNCRSAGAAP